MGIIGCGVPKCEVRDGVANFYNLTVAMADNIEYSSKSVASASLFTYTGTGPAPTGITSFTPTVEIFNTVATTPTGLAINWKATTILAANSSA